MDADSVQTGHFMESKLDGAGIKRMVHEELVFKGDFNAGILSGAKCELETTEGHYIGSIMDGRITGSGLMIYNNGDRYDGYWLEGSYHGKGKLVLASGETFTGEFKNGRREGKGIHIKVNRDGEEDWFYNYEGLYANDMREGYGVLREVRELNDTEGERYIEYFGYFEHDVFYGKGRLLVYEGKRKAIKFEEHDGAFKEGLRDGLGKSIKLKEAEMYGDDEEFRKEVLQAEMLEYMDFVGDFYNDRPVYHSGVLKTVKLPPQKPQVQLMSGEKQKALFRQSLLDEQKKEKKEETSE
jgi:hypothetical protein